jgi:tetratricopeptide (TPR) repeat protein
MTTRMQLGLALGKEEKFEEAISQFNKILNIDPENVQAHYNLGYALRLQGKFDEAIFHFKESIRIGPKNVKAEEMLNITKQEQKNDRNQNVSK